MREDEEELIEQAADESAADDAPQTDVLDGREVPMKPRVAAAVQSLRDRRPPLRAKGIFRHPSDWEQEEIDFIVDALKQHVPIYTIAEIGRAHV